MCTNSRCGRNGSISKVVRRGRIDFDCLCEGMSICFIKRHSDVDKNGIAVQPFKSKADVRENDVVIMSNRDEDTDIRLTMNNVLIYEDFLKSIK